MPCTHTHAHTPMTQWISRKMRRIACSTHVFMKMKYNINDLLIQRMHKFLLVYFCDLIRISIHEIWRFFYDSIKTSIAQNKHDVQHLYINIIKRNVCYLWILFHFKWSIKLSFDFFWRRIQFHFEDHTYSHFCLLLFFLLNPHCLRYFFLLHLNEFL